MQSKGNGGKAVLQQQPAQHESEAEANNNSKQNKISKKRTADQITRVAGYKEPAPSKGVKVRKLGQLETGSKQSKTLMGQNSKGKLEA